VRPKVFWRGGVALHRRQMQCRLVFDTDEKREHAVRTGVTGPRLILSMEDMVEGDCLFTAIGVTTGALVSGRQISRAFIKAVTIVMRPVTGTVRIIRGGVPPA
jgi:fructose-1,6-bisphosphatase II / sedoheptulose-1,7-bisphosphatase